MAINWSDCILDVSHHNGNIDWQHVDPKITLVFVKATQGASFKDPMFEKNRDGVRRSGRYCVPYHFLTPNDPDAQVENFRQCLDRGVPFMLDWEGNLAHTAPAEDVEYIGQMLCDDLKVLVPFGYWGIPGSSPESPTALMKTWIKFTPRYPRSGAQKFGDLAQSLNNLIIDPIWQYTQWGRVTGFPGDVDRSVFRGSPSDLQALWEKLAAGPQKEGE